MSIKKDTSARVTKSGADKTNYSAMPVKMSSLKADGSARNKIGAGSENKNYSKQPPTAPMGKSVGNDQRVASTHKG